MSYRALTRLGFALAAFYAVLSLIAAAAFYYSA